MAPARSSPRTSGGFYATAFGAVAWADAPHAIGSGYVLWNPLHLEIHQSVNYSHLSYLGVGDDPSLKLFGNRLGAPPRGEL